MRYLYGMKPASGPKLAATFDSEQQLLAYVRWATLHKDDRANLKFEQGSALVGYNAWQQSETPLTADDPTAVPHNPSPSML